MARTTVVGACPHDCPDTCSILTTVEDGKAIAVRGNPDHPFTRGRLCVKVNNYEERVYSDKRVLYPLKRVGPKGSRQFQRISWDEAIETIATRWKSIIAEHGAQAILPYSYLGTQGIINGLNVGDPLFNKLGATVSERTFCDSGSCTAYMMTIGPTPGVDPESFVHSKYILLWACNTLGTNSHHWPFIEQARKAGAKLVVIDPVRTRTARLADWHIPIRPGTDAALALAMIHVIIKENLVDRDYIDKHTVGYDELAERASTYTPEFAAQETGIPVDDIVKLAREYATTPPAVVRIGVAVERHAGGGQTVRAIACLPGLIGAWKHVGGGLLQLPIWAFPVKWEVLMRPDLAAGKDARAEFMAARAGADRRTRLRSADQVAVRLQRQPHGHGDRAGQTREGPRARGPVHGGQRTLPDRHGQIRRHRSAGDHPAGTERHHVLVGASLSVL